MMGRSPTTVFTDSTPFEQQASPPPPLDLNSGQHVALIESARAFTIMQRTVTEIYAKRSVSLGLLRQLAHELRTASNGLPSGLRTVAVSNLPNRQYILRNSAVACNYYFSMMVLCRPFLVTSIRSRLSQTRTTTPAAPSIIRSDDRELHSNVLQGAMASVESATHTIRLTNDLLREGILFNSMPLTM
jgi:hypothetical protein